jgi:hypothetical protein
MVKASLKTDSPPPTAPLLVFKLSREVAHRNYCILKRFNMSIEKALGAQSNSPLGYVSEFKKATTLQPLLYLHPNWPCFEKLLNKGSNWPLKDIQELSQAKDIKEALGFGNHKGALLTPNSSPHLSTTMWCMVLPSLSLLKRCKKSKASY